MFITAVGYTTTPAHFLSSLPAFSMSPGESRYKESLGQVRDVLLVQDLLQCMCSSACQTWTEWATPLIVLVRALTDTSIKETVLQRSDVVNLAWSCTKTNGDIQKKIKGGQRCIQYHLGQSHSDETKISASGQGWIGLTKMEIEGESTATKLG